MSRQCPICGRKPKRAMSRSHSNIGTLRRQNLNLQKTIYQGKTIKACVKCIRTMNKVR
ncbi:MAG: bL28 family ribosomal protein [Patescibacteria group bacterium]